uniref:Gypsy retrotransposon integrase-like protein 1 n=1 Tax=Latimeria chalumnae TaxID=7897 RepID=H3AVX3_LATCH
KSCSPLLRTKGFKVNPAKAQFLSQSVSFLGMTIGKDGRTPLQEKVIAIQNLPLPTCASALCSFLGLVNYSRDFIPNYAGIARPLYSLLQKGVEWVWTSQHTKAVEVLKQALIQPPALFCLDAGKLFRLEVAFSDAALSAVLAQDRHGKIYPVAYTRRVLTAVEERFSPCEKAVLATFWAVKHFTFIVGTQKIILVSKHTPTKYLCSDRIKDGTVSNAHLTHWTLLPKDRILEVSKGPALLLLTTLLYKGETHTCSIPDDLEQREKRQERSTRSVKLSLQDGILVFRKNAESVPLWVVPKAVRSELLYVVHDLPTGGHLGVEMTLQRLQDVAWWPEMGKDVEHYCNNCIAYAQNTPCRAKKKAKLRSQRSMGPWNNIWADYIGPLLRTTKNNKYVLVVVYKFSKWMEAFATRNCTARTTATILVKQVFTRWGLALSIESDQGPYFVGGGKLKLLGIEQLHIPYHPQTSGQVERLNRQLKTMIRKFASNNEKVWGQLLPLFQMCLRTVPSKTTGYLPSEILMGGDLSVPQQDAIRVDKYITDLRERLLEVNKQVASNIGNFSQQMKAYYDCDVTATKWNLGDKVVMLNLKEFPLSRRWQGPYAVIDKAGPSIYKLQ